MGVGIVGAKYLWPNRTIPYAVDPAFRASDRLAQAVAHWNSRTGMFFVPRKAERDYLLVTRVAGAAVCDVGRRGGKQKLALGDGCTVGAIVHELGHTIGLWHEHCRLDRDRFVTVDFTNILDECTDNFRQDFICGETVPTRNLGAYDYGSIMHYPADAFPIDPDFPTITPLKPLPPGVEMGQRKALSAGDIAAVETLYAGVPKPVRPR